MLCQDVYKDLTKDVHFQNKVAAFFLKTNKQTNFLVHQYYKPHTHSIHTKWLANITVLSFKPI